MKRLLVLCALIAFASTAFAQVSNTGFPNFGTFERGRFDAINLQNLNTNLTMPISSTKGRGTDLNFVISNNSLVWRKAGATWTPYTDVNGIPTWGWSTTTLGGSVYQTVATVRPNCWWIHSSFAYIEPDGTPHPFGGISYSVKVPPCGNGISGTTSGYATDDSGYYYNALGGGKVLAPDGTAIGGLHDVEDTNGNYISHTYNSQNSEWDYTDTAGHLALKVIKGANSIQYKYQDSTGAYQTVTLVLQNYNIKTNFGCPGVAEYTGTATLPSSISFPNGDLYVFAYEPTPGSGGYYTGRVSVISLAYGGSVHYTYGGANDGINCSDGTTVNLTRVTYDATNTATWQFTRALNGSNWVTTETKPQMPYDSATNQTVYTFNSSGQEVSHQIYQGNSSSGTLLRTVNTTWAANGSPATRTTILENNQQSRVATTYDSYGNLTNKQEYNFGNGSPGQVLRTTAYTFLSTSAYVTRNILNRPTEETIADSSGTVRYRLDTTYDGTTIGPCPTGVAQHDDSSYPCTFTTRGNPTSVTMYTDASVPSGGVTKSSYYDVFGNLVQADVDCCTLKKWNYSSATNYTYPDSYICGSPSGHQLTTSFTYNSYTGQMATSTDPSNQVTSFAYDLMRRPAVTTRPDSVQLTISYNDTNHSSTFTQPILGTNSLKTSRHLDGLARLANTILTDSSNNTYSNVQESYDPLENPYKVSDPFTGSPQYWKEANFDGVGRAVKTILQDNSQVTYAYSGQYTTVTDPTGKQRKFEYDGAGRIVKIFEPDPSNNNSLTLQTTYTYMVLDKISSVTQGSQTRSYAFDGMGRLTSKTTPEGGTTTYQYTNFDKVSQRTDARGVVTNYSYDNLNRLQQVSYNVGTTGVPATPTVIYTYGTDPTKYNNGRLLTVTDGPGSETYLYDLLGRVTQEQDVIGGNTYTIGYQYNSANELVSTTYPSQRVVQANYDNIGRLASLTSGSTTLASNISYNPNDQITGFTYGSGVSASYTYLPDRLQTQAMSYTKGGATLFGVTYSYSQNGGNDSEVTGITDSFDSGRNLTFTYDALRRLATANSQGSVNYPQWGLSFTYDRYGNRTAQTVTAGSGPSNSVSVSATTNRITTPGYSYDANGNMTSDGQNTIVYDAENRVVSDADGIGTATYLYQANGRRASKTVAGATTVYIYAGEHPIAEYVNGGLTNEYVYLSDQLLAGYISGTLYYYLPDRISIRAVTDSSGNLVAQQGHFPFGESWYSSGSATEFQFTNYIRDTESGNDYALSRYYINRLARFASLDPARGNTKDPQQWTRYSYVANDPVGRTDPTGLCGVVGRKCLPQMGGCSGCGGGCGCDAFIDPTGCMGCDPVADPLNCVPSFSGGGTGGCNPDIDPSCLFGGGCGCSAESPEGCGGGGGGSRGPGGINNLGKLVDSAACSRSNPNSLPRCNTCCNNASLVHFLACLAAGLLDPLAGEVCAEVSGQWDLECRTCCDQVLHTGKPCKLPYTGGSSVRIRSSIWEHY